MPRKSKEITRIKIELVAAQLFSQRNFNDVTVDEIAAAANITRRTLYQHFPSKLTLFASIFEKYLKNLFDDLAVVYTQEKSVKEIMKDLLTTLFNFSTEHPNFMREFWMLDADNAGEGLPKEVMQHIHIWNRACVDLGVEFYTKHKSELGLFEKYDAEMLVHYISAINKGIFIQTEKEKASNMETVDSNQLLQIFLDQILMSFDNTLLSKDK
ncbi:TetR/AcrR family transcriptional regulator [Lacrimispora sp.]|uniref:TetR/AcrR family transcriptional regulator n=1 Tax=Lacrimispora sp. TaxID=2719234 RepID=UPI0028991AB8|nr:TetR/AcrR family transcriptional regulator [Lacrimispora sp.]